MQGYWDVKNPSLKDIEETINLYSELGLELQLTEWTIPVKSDSEDGFIQQAERYASVLKLLQKFDIQGGGNANITCVSFFGLQDGFSLNINDTNTSRLYDKDFNPKPVYYSIQDVFRLYYQFASSFVTAAEVLHSSKVTKSEIILYLNFLFIQIPAKLM